MGMRRDSFVAKRGTTCRRSGNHLGTTFIRAQLELKLREGKQHPFPLFALLANMLTPTMCGRKCGSESLHFRGRTRFHPEVDWRCTIRYVPPEIVYRVPFSNSPLSDADHSLADALLPSMLRANHRLPFSL